MQNGVLGRIGMASDAVPRPEKALNANDLPTRIMGVVDCMEGLVLVQGPRKDAPGYLRLTCGMGDIPKTS